MSLMKIYTSGSKKRVVWTWVSPKWMFLSWFNPTVTCGFGTGKGAGFSLCRAVSALGCSANLVFAWFTSDLARELPSDTADWSLAFQTRAPEDHWHRFESMTPRWNLSVNCSSGSDQNHVKGASPGWRTFGGQGA